MRPRPVNDSDNTGSAGVRSLFTPVHLHRKCGTVQGLDSLKSSHFNRQQQRRRLSMQLTQPSRLNSLSHWNLSRHFCARFLQPIVGTPMSRSAGCLEESLQSFTCQSKGGQRSLKPFWKTKNAVQCVCQCWVVHDQSISVCRVYVCLCVCVCVRTVSTANDLKRRGDCVTVLFPLRTFLATPTDHTRQIIDFATLRTDHENTHPLFRIALPDRYDFLITFALFSHLSVHSPNGTSLSS